MTQRTLPAGAIVITPSDARMLYQAANLRELRIRYRVGSTAIYDLLTDISRCAFEQDIATSIGTEQRQTSASEERETWTVNQLARRTGRAPRTIRLDIEKNALPATKHCGTWAITAADANTYIAGRRTT